MRLLFSLIFIMGFSAFADDSSDLGDESFNITAPISVYWDGKEKKNTVERKSVVCFTYKGKVECALNVLGLSCDNGRGSFYHGEYSTNDGNMKLKNLDLSSGILSFEYSMSGDKFTCDGRFSTKIEKMKLTSEKTIDTKVRKLKSFSCQGIFSKFSEPLEVLERLREEHKLSKFCPDTSF